MGIDDRPTNLEMATTHRMVPTIRVINRQEKTPRNKFSILSGIVARCVRAHVDLIENGIKSSEET